MTDFCKKFISKLAFLNFGVPTAIISVLIYWFTSKGVTQVPMSQLPMENIISTILTAFIIACFGPMVAGAPLKKLDHKLIIGIDKKQHSIMRFVPQSYLGGAVMICVIITVVVGFIPFGLLALLQLDFTISRVAYAVFKLFFSLLVAFAAGWLGICNALYLKNDEGEVLIDASV